MHDLMRGITTGVQVLVLHHRRLARDSRAKKPSSSSLRLGAGSGAPGASLCVGSLT